MCSFLIIVIKTKLQVEGKNEKHSLDKMLKCGCFEIIFLYVNRSIITEGEKKAESLFRIASDPRIPALEDEEFLIRRSF